MPFKSTAQRGFLYAKHPEVAKKFAKHGGGGGKNLPKHVAKKKDNPYKALRGK